MHRSIGAILLVIQGATVSAQTSFSKWIVQSGDSVNDNFLGHMDLTRLANGDLLNCTCRDEWGSYEKCRFVRISPTGDPVQQWEVSMMGGGSPNSIWLNKVIERSDGSFACFGRYGYASLYLQLDPGGNVIAATSYEITGIGVIAPLEWNDAVQDPGGRFTLAGDWGGMNNNAMMARIEADGTLLSHHLIQIGTQGYTYFHDVERLANGDHVFCGASNYTSFHPKTYLFRTDSLLTPQWARAYPDSGYNYTYAKLHVLPGNDFRITLRETDPGFVGGTLMVAATSAGTPLWAKRRIPTAGYPSMNMWPKTAQLVNGTTMMLSGGAGAGASGHDEFVQLLNTNGDELAMVELDIPTPVVGCLGDADTYYLGGMNHGPLGLGAYSFGLTQLDLDLDLCSPVSQTTGSQTWFPSTDTTWSEVAVPLTVTDVTSSFTSAPTTAYPVTICLSTSVTTHEQQDLAVVPNPASDRVTIQAVGIEHVEITDAIGRVVLARSLRAADAVDLDLHSLAPGIHHVRALTNKGWVGGKLIKQ